MLTGKVSYHDTELGKDVYYQIRGYSFQSSLSLIVTAQNEEAINYWTDDTPDTPEQFFARNERTVRISPSKIEVETELNEIKDRAWPVAKTFPSLMALGVNLMIRLGTQNYVKVDKKISDDGMVSYNYHQDNVLLDRKSQVAGAVSGRIEYPRNSSAFSLRNLVFDLPTFHFELHEDGKNDTNMLPRTKAFATVRINVQKAFKAMGFLDLNNPNSNEKLFEPVGGTEKGMFLKSLDEVIERYPNKNLSWIRNQNYTMVNDYNVEGIVKHLMTFPYLGVDTETTGLGITFKSSSFVEEPFSDQLVGVIVSGQPGESYFFPMQMNTVPNLCNGDHDAAMHKYIQPLLKRPIVLFNAAFDAKVFMIYHLQVNLRIDIMVALQDTYGYEENIKRVSLKQMTSRLLNRDAIEIENLTRSGSYNGANFADVPAELVLAYACPDGDNTLSLYKYILEHKVLEKHNAVKLVKLDSHFALCIAYQEFFGQHINIDKLPELRQELTDELSKNLELMKGIIIKQNLENKKTGKEPVYDPEAFNPNSTPQLLHIVYEGLGAPVQKKFDKTKNKFKPTLDKTARKELLSGVLKKGTPAYDFVQAYQEYNDSNTMVKNFTKNLTTLMSKDGYTFSRVNQFLNTGRLAVQDPPYQNYSKPIKKYIVPRPGFGMSDNDFQSIEYKVIAGLSQEPRLLKAFQDPNTDYHRLQAANMYRIPYELITHDQRSSAKKFNFGIPFGMGPESLGERLKGERSPENTAYAKVMLKRYFNGQEKVEQFFNTRRAFAVRNHYSETLFGRRRYYDPRISSKGDMRRKGGNQPIQGTAADMFKFATVRMYYLILKKGWFGKVLMSGFIHDEMLFEVSKSINPIDWLATLKEQVELKLKGFPPIFLGWGYGANWYQAKVFDIPTQLQNELIANGAEKEYPNWDGDLEKFNTWLINRADRFEHEQILNFLTNKENEGKSISPVLWGYLESNISDIPEVKEANESKNHLSLNQQVQYFKQKFNLDQVVTLHDPTDKEASTEVEEDAELQEAMDGAKDAQDDSGFVKDPIYDMTNEEQQQERERRFKLKKFQERLAIFGSTISEDKQSIVVLEDDIELPLVVQMHNYRSKSNEDENNEDLLPVSVYDQEKNKLFDLPIKMDYERDFVGFIEHKYSQRKRQLEQEKEKNKYVTK